MKLSSYNLIIYKSPYSYWYNTFTKILPSLYGTWRKSERAA